MMPCPKCDSANSIVKDSRPTMIGTGHAAIRRRRACGKCTYRWTTFETIGGDQRLGQQVKKLTAVLQRATQDLQSVSAELNIEAGRLLADEDG